MEEHTADVANRPRVIDVSNERRSDKNTHRRNRQRKQRGESLPLEMGPVIRAAHEYGRMAAALGARRGASELQRIASRIRALNPDQAVLDILEDADKSVARLNAAFAAGYGR